jgi:hypothetical protein
MAELEASQKFVEGTEQRVLDFLAQQRAMLRGQGQWYRPASDEARIHELQVTLNKKDDLIQNKIAEIANLHQQINFQSQQAYLAGLRANKDHVNLQLQH